jgi:Na+/H+ antiporter NhaC
MEFGAFALIPIAIVLIVAIVTKRAAEALFVGSVVAALVYAIGTAGGDWYVAWWTTVAPWDWANGTGWFDVLVQTLGGYIYYAVLFGMFGAIIRILDMTGAAAGFATAATRFANTRKKTLFTTFVLGIIIFIDDYLNAFGVGVAMRPLSDKAKISREFMAYVINSTGAAVCILVPVSSWAAVYSGYLDTTQESYSLFDTAITGIDAYAKSVPFMVYSWVALIVCLLFIFKVIPLFGGMKKAEERAEKTGRVFPDWYYDKSQMTDEEKEKAELAEEQGGRNAGWWNFVIPVVSIVVFALLQKFVFKVEIDLVMLVIIAVVIAGVMLIAQNKLKLGEFADAIVGGFKDMAYVTILVMLAWVLQEFNDMLQLTPWVIESVEPILSPALLPMIAFIVVGALAFATGSFWGVAAISFPIILPLAQSMHVDIFLTIGVIAGATAFGSHACFYSDAVTVTSAATGIRNIDYAKTALPLIALGAVVSIIVYGILGFAMAP